MANPVKTDAKQLAMLIERQCDDMATGSQMREFLRDDYDEEPQLRQLLRLNLEQFAKRLEKLRG